MLLMFFARLIHVSDNKDLINIKRKGYKFKYKPIDLSIQDFEFWLKNAEAPETIYVKSKKGINYKFEISFECRIYSNYESQSCYVKGSYYDALTEKGTVNFFKAPDITFRKKVLYE